jgi:sugar lactone lactonase YvrE
MGSLSARHRRISPAEQPLRVGFGAEERMAEAKMEAVAGGFGLLESPRAEGGDLCFTDMAVGGVYRRDADGAITRFLSDRRMIGGLALNADGRWLCSGTGGIAWLDPEDGTSGTLLDAIDGVPISGVNDMIADGRGGLYFGMVDHRAMFAGEDFYGRSAIHHLAPDGSVRLARDRIAFANGMGLSPDGGTLYLNNSGVGTFAYRIGTDGGLSDERRLSDRPDCDGLVVDAEGALWVAYIAAGSVARVLPDGTVAEEHAVPGGHPTAVALGGVEGRDLFITTAAPGAGDAVRRQQPPPETSAILYRMRVAVPGLPLARTAFA